MTRKATTILSHSILDSELVADHAYLVHCFSVDKSYLIRREFKQLSGDIGEVENAENGLEGEAELVAKLFNQYAKAGNTRSDAEEYISEVKESLQDGHLAMNK